VAQQILVPVDGSEHAFHAVDVACIIARQLGGTLRLVHVVPDRAVPEGLKRFAELEHIQGPPEYVYTAAVAENVLNAGRDRAADNDVKDVETAVEYGDAAKGILEVANRHDVDMIVMGTRGLSDIQGLLFGSVAHKVSHDATCRVVIVK